MSRSLSRQPAVAKAQPSLQQQLASGKRAKAARQAQQAHGRRKAPEAVLPAPEAAASVGASVAGAGHVSASRLLALLKQPAVAAAQSQPPVSSPAAQSVATVSGRDVEHAASSPIHATLTTAPFAASPTSSTISNNRTRQMTSNIFNNYTTTQPPPHHPPPTHQPPPPPPSTTAHQPTPLIVPPTTTAVLPPHVQPVVTSPTGRQSWGGGGRSLEDGDGARDADRQKKLEMRASLDAQMREKEEKKRQDRLQANATNGRVQEHWLDAHARPQPMQGQPQPLSTASEHQALSHDSTHQPSPTSTAASSHSHPLGLSTSRTLSSPPPPSTQHPSAPSSTVHLSSIRSHNQSSSVFTTTGTDNDTAEQRKAKVRAEVQAGLRQQMEERKVREEEKKRVEAEDERRWEEKLERERKEMASRYVNGAVGPVAVEEERKEVVLTVKGGRKSATVVGVAQEEKQQLSAIDDRKEKVEKKRSTSDSDSVSDDESEERRRRRKHRDRKASRERGKRSTRRHSDSDDSASSYSDASDRHSHSRRHKSSNRQRSRRRERRSRYSSQSEEEERVEDECIYVTDSAYTHRLRYEQEQKEIESTLMSASTSRRSSARQQSKPSSSSSSRSSSALSAPSAPQSKPPFGVRSLQSRAKPKPPASRVRPAPKPLPAGDTKASKQALSAARLAMGRTSGGGDKFVAQKWKEKRATTDDSPRQAGVPQKAVDRNVGRDGRDSERRVVMPVVPVHSAVNEVVASVQELNFADRLDSTSEWLLPHSLGLPSFRG